MTWHQFIIIFSLTLIAMIACRVLPAFVLKGKQISPKVQTLLNLIPPAAFASLVANDLFKPGMFDSGFWPACIPLIATGIVILIARQTKSIIVCCLAGIGIYAVLMFAVPGFYF